ncbi:hypothetical protein ABI57_21965 [Salmonella enterica subsp. enterica serovar Veneziana]|nr:hypothetical protein ABI57_21965 [Salmonella enterica subsp. enterica serovar Veneziana]
MARLMAVMGLASVLRGKKVRTTVSRKAVAACDRVNRQFMAERPNLLWVASADIPAELSFVPISRNNWKKGTIIRVVSALLV